MCKEPGHIMCKGIKSYIKMCSVFHLRKIIPATVGKKLKWGKTGDRTSIKECPNPPGKK